MPKYVQNQGHNHAKSAKSRPKIQFWSGQSNAIYYIRLAHFCIIYTKRAPFWENRMQFRIYANSDNAI